MGLSPLRESPAGGTRPSASCFGTQPTPAPFYACRARARRSLGRRSALQPIGKRHDGSMIRRPREEWVAAGSIPALVTQEQYDLVQQKLERNKQFASRNNKAHDYLLRALVSCGLCGLACTGRTLKGYGYYTCAGKRAMEAASKGGRCRSRLTPVGQLDEVVWKDLCEIIRHPALSALELERAWGGQWLPEELRARRTSLREDGCEPGAATGAADRGVHGQCHQA